jgi:hypothetical protein
MHIVIVPTCEDIQPHTKILYVPNIDGGLPKPPPHGALTLRMWVAQQRVEVKYYIQPNLNFFCKKVARWSIAYLSLWWWNEYSNDNWSDVPKVPPYIADGRRSAKSVAMWHYQDYRHATVGLPSTPSPPCASLLPDTWHVSSAMLIIQLPASYIHSSGHKGKQTKQFTVICMNVCVIAICEFCETNSIDRLVSDSHKKMS